MLHKQYKERGNAWILIKNSCRQNINEEAKSEYFLVPEPSDVHSNFPFSVSPSTTIAKS
jgi:hypothetical protein